MKISPRTMAYMAVVASAYAIITITQGAIGFGAIQFRIAESLNLLAFFNPIFAPAVALGVFLSNLIMSPYGILDAILGTLATVIALTLIRITKKLFDSLLIASIWPTLINAIIIPLVILISGGGISALTWSSFLPIALSVFIGQFVVVNIFGYALFRILQARHKNFIKKLEEL
ncbi:MAG: QueT transporter family protein [Defluviitaleaceae bacterium]|nr:QueT transporter family protein [Defluviitaleaceae bacterium]